MDEFWGYLVAGEEVAREVRRVMLEQLTRCLHIDPFANDLTLDHDCRQLIFSHILLEEQLQLLDGKAALPQHVDFILQQFYDSTLHSEFTPLAVNNRDIAVEEIVEDVDCLGGADVAEEIGARGTDGQLTGLDQLSCEGMLRCPDAYKSSLSGDDDRQDVEIGLEDNREWSRPVLLCEQVKYHLLLRTHLDQLLGLSTVKHMNDDRVSQGPLLGRIYPLQSLRIERVSSQAIDRLRRKSHQISIPDRLSCFLDILFSQNACRDELRCRRSHLLREVCLVMFEECWKKLLLFILHFFYKLIPYFRTHLQTRSIYDSGLKSYNVDHPIFEERWQYRTS